MKVEFQTRSRRDFGDAAYGEVGEYEQIDGTVVFSVDPDHPANRNIVDLRLAPANAQGRVEFRADFSLVAPKDLSRGNGRLIVDVPNRGNKLVGGHFHQVVVTTPEDRDKPGDGFLCHRGFSFLSIGWQWDAQAEGGLGLDAPMALEDGKPIEGDVLMRLQPDHDCPDMALIQLGQTAPSYPVIHPDSDGHRLYQRSGAGRQQIDRNQWRFARSGPDGEQASTSHILLENGFTKGTTYELVYRTRGAPVVGCGLLAIRDAAACLRFGDPGSPLASGFEHAFVFGVSQTGRVLRQFLYEGLNRDEDERVVYDGMLIHIAGGQRGDFNHRFAMPTVANIPGLGQRFPFAASHLEDPLTGRTDGLLNHLDSDATPRIMFSNTSWEYWRGDASLIHIQDGHDLPEHPSTRVYHIAGTHHIGGILAGGKQVSKLPTGLHTAVPLNVVNSAPVFRALFMALDAWVVSGAEPPPSAHPRIDDGTAVPREVVLDRFGEQTDLPLPDPERLIGLHRMSFGTRESEGISAQPVEEYEPYPAFVSAVDARLNETAGIRMPDIAVPIGLHTGWNPRSEAIGASGELATFAGMTVFFDRAGILAAYPTEDAYASAAADAVTSLVDAGYVLEGDRDWLINVARSRYRAATQ